MALKIFHRILRKKENKRDRTQQTNMRKLEDQSWKYEDQKGFPGH